MQVKIMRYHCISTGMNEIETISSTYNSVEELKPYAMSLLTEM